MNTLFFQGELTNQKVDAKITKSNLVAQYLDVEIWIKENPHVKKLVMMKTLVTGHFFEFKPF